MQTTNAVPGPEEKELLEAPDMDPKTVFDVPSLALVGGLSLMVAVAASYRFGTLAALILFLVLSYNGVKMYRALANRFPPGYWMDKISWIRTKPFYFPGKAKPRAPLVAR